MTNQQLNNILGYERERERERERVIPGRPVPFLRGTILEFVGNLKKNGARRLLIYLKTFYNKRYFLMAFF